LGVPEAGWVVRSRLLIKWVGTRHELHARWSSGRLVRRRFGTGGPGP
jgi:hypothetical protein